MPKFFITTAIPYTNAAPHIGFAMELVQADCVARFHRMIGDDVRFLTGTSEHGTKMEKTATELGTAPELLAEKNAAEFKRLIQALNASPDDFIRTSEERHIKGAQKLWQAMEASGDLYKGKYEGFYCVGCEAYLTEKDIENGMCPIHKRKPEFFSEENVFFRYTKYLPQVKRLLEDGHIKILPEFRKNEMINLISEGIEEKRDTSFSRPAKSLTLGISVPGNPSQTMYVWPDELTNYITALGYAEDSELFQKYWPADAHCIGKDILRFHAGLWPAMLLSAKIAPPKTIYVHGFVTSEGHKMSKSLGNVVDPFSVTEKYGVDAVRYYLLREIPTAEDGDFSRDRFEALYNGELANNLGNFVSRVLVMAEKYSEGKTPAISKEEAIVEKTLETWKLYQSHVAEFNLKAAAESIFALLNFANQYIDEKRPWELAKKEPAQVLQILYHLLELLRHVSFMLLPFLPQSAEKIQAALGFEKQKLYPDNIAWGVLKEGTSVKKIEALFPRLGSRSPPS